MMREKDEETVSRVLCAVFCPRTAISLGRTFPSASSDLDPRAPGGPPFPRMPSAGLPSYSVLLRVGFAVPRRSPGAR